MGNSADRWGYGLLVAAILSALALAAPALQGQPLALDEHVSYYCSGAPTLTELWLRCEEVAVLPPLSHLFERLALAIGGRTESALRLPSIIAYILAVPTAWWLGRLAGGPVCAGLTALIVAWHPGMVDEVRFARCYGLVLFLSTLSTAFLFRWRSTPDRLAWFAPWSLSAAALCWTHYLAAPLVAVQSVVLLVLVWRLPRAERGPARSVSIVAVLFAAVTCIPLIPAILRLHEVGAVIEFQRLPASLAQAFGAVWTLPALAVIALSLAWNRIQMRKQHHQPAASPVSKSATWISLALWLVPLAVIGAMAIWSSPMLASPRYRVMIVPASALTLGLALSRAFVPLVGSCLAAVLLAGAAHLHGFLPRTPARLVNLIEAEWRRIGQELSPRINDPSLLVFTQTGLAEAIIVPGMPDSPRLKSYVACRLGGFYTGAERALPIPILWDFNGPLLRQYQALLRAPALREVRIVGADDTDLNKHSVELFSAFLRSAGFQMTDDERRPGITILTFKSPRE